MIGLNPAWVMASLRIRLVNLFPNLLSEGNENKLTRLPVEIVSDFLQDNKNYFNDLEIKAELTRKKIYFEEGHRTIGYTLLQYLFNNLPIIFQ